MEPFKIFISFSGKFSQEIAEVLKHWLNQYDVNLKIHVSSEDLVPGVEWGSELNTLLDSDYGILILTKDNVNSPWVLFEAGAVSKAADTKKEKKEREGRVCPILFGRDPEKLEAPISKYNYLEFKEQDFEFSKKEMEKLLSYINEVASGENKGRYRIGL